MQFCDPRDVLEKDVNGFPFYRLGAKSKHAKPASLKTQKR